MNYKTAIVWVAACAVLILLIVGAVGGTMVKMPGKTHKGPLPPLTPEEKQLADRLHEHVLVLAGQIGERNVAHYHALQDAAQYVGDRLREYGLTVGEQSELVEGRTVVNLEGVLRGSRSPEEVVVIGAHYDSAPGTPGANDNATGVAALLELARRFAAVQPERTLRFVAFTNEEPPYFQGKAMGSMIYARRCRERGENIVAMLSLETMGCYYDKAGSQRYPAPLDRFYPDTGDFIAFVGNVKSRDIVHRAIGTFRKTTRFPSQGVAAPERLPGIGWSDQWSFWQLGYPGIMITDTAPFRYPHYHQPSDTPDKIDYGKLSRVVAGLDRVVGELISN
ncbi:M28 family peptidase [Geomonas oryzisoli]|uniref:M28 family peptidase n=1 Tax=Geomonas oryzisoli TaxID=2847992 RepID=A0ABX8J6H8_9BACT|nr:M28 family peptidase [Geomonas oryzisoli]QWV93403.1 M28 family peptidase [Geomonas oryzisoli]